MKSRLDLFMCLCLNARKLVTVSENQQIIHDVIDNNFIYSEYSFVKRILKIKTRKWMHKKFYLNFLKCFIIHLAELIYLFENIRTALESN